MPILQKSLMVGLAAASLLAATMEAAEARRHYGYYGYAPTYSSYRTYGYRGYYGSAYGRRCQPEFDGHVGPKTCAYRR
jgi:hypothetical protein